MTLWKSNAQSLLSEIHRLQSLLDGMTQKVALLIAQLREKEALLAEKESRIKELERQIKKNSQNSSKPPSSDGVRKPAPKSLRTPSGKKPGGQPGHKGDTLRAGGTPDAVVNLPVTRCSCGEDLSLLPVTEHECRQVFDLPLPRLEVTEYCLDKVCCPACQKVIVAPAPPEVTAPTQYGLRFLSYLASLHQDQGIPLGRVCQISSDLFGAVVSEGTILQACQRLDQQLAPFVDHTRELLKISPVVHVDETSLRVDGRNAWCHVASTPRLTLLALHEKRSPPLPHRHERHRNPQKTIPRGLDGTDRCHGRSPLHSFRRLNLPRCSSHSLPLLLSPPRSEVHPPLASVKGAAELLPATECPCLLDLRTAND